MPTETRDASYPLWIGFIFIFNLIVGTGALTLPGVFAKAGWLLSLIVIMLLAVISYMTVTFVIEAMACANAVKNWQNLEAYERSYDHEHESDSDAEQSLLPRANHTQENSNIEASQTSNTSIGGSEPNSDRMRLDGLERSTQFYYKLDDKFELGEMAVLFYNDVGRMIFYLCIAIYLYGDLSIYSTAIAKSMRDVLCDAKNGTAVTSLIGFAYVNNDDKNTTCWSNHTISRLNVYRLFLIGFTTCFGPLAAFSVHKTKYLQILTTIFRWLAFTFMIAIAVKLLVSYGARNQPPAANIYGLPSLFGACVYSFMCHHSLPGVLAPIRNKSSLNTVISYDYILICLFYILLAMTGIFAFEHLEDLYTLNFIPSKIVDDSFKAEVLIAIDYFLALFPVFTLSTSYPIMAITLRNNLQTLFLDMTRFETYNYFVRRILFPLITVLPPFAITYFTENLASLVVFTGSYAGAGIQYLIPISLIYFARRTCRDLLGNGVVNEFQSPFRSTFWLYLVLIWAVACMCLVTINFFFISKSAV